MNLPAEMQPESEPNAIFYPKRYNLPWAVRILPLTMLAYTAFHMLTLWHHPAGAAGLLIVLLIMFLINWAIWSYRIVLEQHQIAQHSVFAKRFLLRNDISGYRRHVIQNRVGSKISVELLPQTGSSKPWLIPDRIAKDVTFRAWLDGIPNADSEAEQTMRLSIEQDTRLGSTPEERLAQVARQLRLGRIAGYGYLAAAIVVGIYPHPTALVFLIPALGPWLAILLLQLRGQDVTILESGSAIAMRKVNLMPLLSTPIFSYALYFRIHPGDLPGLPLHILPLVTLALAGGALLTTLIWLVSRKPPLTQATLATVFVALSLNSGGLAALSNGLFDTATAQDYRLQVIRQYQTHGRGASNHLVVSSADSGYNGSRDFTVPYDLYRDTPAGQFICASIHPGALLMPWESVMPCPTHQQTDQTGTDSSSMLAQENANCNGLGPMRVRAQAPTPIAGTVIGLVSDAEAASLLRLTEQTTNGQIDPDYITNQRVVVHADSSPPGQNMVALVQQGMHVDPGEKVFVSGGHASARLACHYVPNLISARHVVP